MKSIFGKLTGFTKIEFWVVSTICVFLMFFFLREAIDNISHGISPNKERFDKANVPFSFYSNYFFPVLLRFITLFGTFFLLNFIIVPRLLAGKAIFKNLFLLITIVIAAALSFGFADIYFKGHLYPSGYGVDAADQSIFYRSFLQTIVLLAYFALYTVIRYSGIWILSKADRIQARYSFITREGIVATLIWLLILFALLADPDRDTIAIWCIVVPFAILLFSYSFYSLIPKSLRKKSPRFNYVFIVTLILLITMLPVLFIAILTTKHEDVGTAITIFNMAVQFFLTAPLSWILYKRHMRGKEQLNILQTQLGKSNANLDFLRSQINPHFLFNALNTIYGTAIQEKAERTSEGIEKLGDMMRFMLQENMQDRISLSREIDYLNNYISLQKLRTDPNPGILIETNIEEASSSLQIAPMLLIPFVENAFKHGISFREPTFIKVKLEIKNNTLNFEVNNSKHARQDADPEKDKSGVGLENVKQRLELLYLKRYELKIHETEKSFRVHLRLELK